MFVCLNKGMTLSSLTSEPEKGALFTGLEIRVDTRGKLPVDSSKRNYQWKMEKFLFYK